jgi:hypothetical protein
VRSYQYLPCISRIPINWEFISCSYYKYPHNCCQSDLVGNSILVISLKKSVLAQLHVASYGFLERGQRILDFGLKFNLPTSLVRRAGLNESLVKASLDS